MRPAPPDNTVDLEAPPHRQVTEPGQISDVLISSCSRALGRPITPVELGAAGNYLKILLKWQRSQRLVASGDLRWIAEHLLADSLLFLEVLPASAQNVVDVGSGAGFPGIPLKIFAPELSISLVESRQRRASFLRAVVRELDLRGVEVLDRRLESLSPRLDGSFDAATMRCAGEPRRLLSSILPLIRSGGVIVASGPPTGDRAEDEGLTEVREANEATPVFEPIVVQRVSGSARQFLVARKS